jgi:phosphatidylethanolamine/phosphatidyl-N-methylethanolamine N-methyltransferase
MLKKANIEKWKMMIDPVSDFYENYYSLVFSNKGFSSYFNSITHKKLEEGIDLEVKTPLSILEIGAGKAEHLKYVKTKFDSYVMLDLLSKPNELPNIPKLSWVQGDICDSEINRGSFDRIIATCVFHHLSDPTVAFENVKKMLKPGGIFSLFLPSDPGILNRIVRKLFVTPASKKVGFSQYELVNAREHKNHYWGLKIELKNQLKDFEVKYKYFPFLLPFGNASLFSIWQIRSTQTQHVEDR